MAKKRWRNAGGHRIRLDGGARMYSETCCCGICNQLTTPIMSDMEVELSGITNGSCTACTSYNDTYILGSAEPETDCCRNWSVSYAGLCGSTPYGGGLLVYITNTDGDDSDVTKWVITVWMSPINRLFTVTSGVIVWRLTGALALAAIESLLAGGQVTIPHFVSGRGDSIGIPSCAADAFTWTGDANGVCVASSSTAKLTLVP